MNREGCLAAADCLRALLQMISTSASTTVRCLEFADGRTKGTQSFDVRLGARAPWTFTVLRFGKIAHC